MKICFAATPDFAVPILEAVLRSRHAVELVVTQPDKPSGRGRQPWTPPIKELALACGVPVIQPASINEAEAVACLRSAAPDAILVAAYGKRLSRRLLRLPRLGCFNVHASLLPKYRGAAPIAHAILHGDSETGVTIQRMASDIDTGAILMRCALKIADEETAGELSARLSDLAARMIAPMLDALEAGTAVEQPQEEADATAAPRLKKEDGLAPWQVDAKGVCDFIRAMTPWPGAFTFLRTAAGEERGRLILLAARPAEHPGAGARPGEILPAKDELIVAAGRGCVSVLRVKPEGGKPMDAAAYVRGHRVKPGDTFHGS